MRTYIDNAGGGNCGYYAMAIGLIEIIKEHPAILVKWQQLDPSLALGVDFFDRFDLQEMANNPRQHEKESLDVLQASLRRIAYNSYLEHVRLQAAQNPDNVRGTHFYNKFAELVEYYKNHTTGSPNTDFNELAHSQDMLRLAKANRNATEAEIQQLFINNIDAIQHAARKITDNGYWATEEELSAIAHCFEVNLSINQQNMGFVDANKPTVVLNNHGNTHWTTAIQTMNPSPQLTLQTSREVYQIVEQSKLPIAMKRDLMELIALYQTGQLAGQSTDDVDLKLAKELQEEEFRLAGIKKG